MLKGTLIAESLRRGVALEVPLVVRRISRHAPVRTAVFQPDVWTHIDFEVDEDDAEALAESLAEGLHRPAWYADFCSSEEIFVVFPSRVFRYPRGDLAARKRALEFGRRMGVPSYQLDWPV